LNTHEYQAKSLIKRFGIPVPPFILATNEQEILEGIKELGLQEGVAKAQVHAGGRGKAGGIQVAHTPEELLRKAKQLLGMRLHNQQTGPQGMVCEKVMLTPLISIEKEYYLAAFIDRARGEPVLLASPSGGVEIEELARTQPELLTHVPIQLDGYVRHYHLLEVAKKMGWEGALLESGIKIVAALAKAFIAADASLLEINPLILSSHKQLIALDAKLSIDDNALYRQPALKQWDDPHQKTQGERLAEQEHLAYIGLDGAIGCLVNGAGLAMATMDIIQYYGGRPANFLDVGGSATQEQITHALNIIMLDKRVRVIFVNIFGGIMDCSILAQGMIEALRRSPTRLPVIVRLEGTHMQLGKKYLEESGLEIRFVQSMEEGAQEAIKWQS